MKKYLIFASAVASLVVAGCAKDRNFAGNQVSFSASTGALETRTDYGEDGPVGGTSVTYTYVNWVAGDKIKILSSTGSSDTYTVTEDHDGSDSQGISKANVNPDNSGIAWGTGTQTFYAMYPANVSGSSLTDSTMTCAIPATWTPANETALGQLPYGYMFAKTTTTRTTSVSLTFDPKFTAFTFTLKNPTETAVTLSSFTLSSASKAMNGTYTVNTSNGSVGTLPTAGSNSLTVDFSSWSGGGLVIPACTTAGPGTKTFTLVTVPNTFDDLSISCTIDGVTTTRGLKKNNSFLSFAAGLKHNISIYLPGTAPVDNSFKIMFGGGTESGKSAFETGGEQAEGTFYNHPISQGFNNENIKYLGIWSSVPAGGSHNALQVFSDYIAIQDRGTSPTKGGIYFELSDTYNDYTPTKIEIECSAGTGSKIKVYFNTDSAANPARITDAQDVYSSGESGKKVLIYTQSTTPSIPTTALRDIKIINTTSSVAAINIYSVKVYF